MYKLNANIIKRKVHDTYFLIDITDNYSDDKRTLYEMNEVGNFIWENIDNVGEPVSYISNLLINEIKDDDINYDMIYSDVKEFIRILLLKGFIKEL